jgi:hypothetical protein
MVRRLSALWPLLAVAALAVATPAAARVLRVGTYHGIRGQFRSIQAAIDAARPGDWILIGPGDYHERADRRSSPGPQPADVPAAVVIAKSRIHLRGMNRNRVVVDGTKPGSPKCSSKPSNQDLGITGPDGKTLGRNGILIWKANDTWVENLTVCNAVLGGEGEGSTGNGIWWDGGHGSGKIGIHGLWGNYITATTTYFSGRGTAEDYGIFTSNSTDGSITHAYTSNAADSGFYIGACAQVCNQTLNHVWSQFNALGYSGTNSGGQLIVENSQFDHNQDGFDTNSQDNDDAISPQDGACAHGAISPITHTHSCWVFIHNYVHDNNYFNAPGFGVAAAGPVGTGLSISGGRDNTVMDNTFANNGAWGVILVPYIDTETPTPPEACQGGIYAGPPTYLCVFDDWGNAIVHNTFIHNGFYGNTSNGDIAELTTTAAASNCFDDNIDAQGVTTSPAGLEQSKPRCGGTVLPDANVAFTNQVLCDSQFFGPTPCIGANYPKRSKVEIQPLPRTLNTMPHPCAHVPRNPWCPGRKGKHHRHHSA